MEITRRLGHPVATARNLHRRLRHRAGLAPVQPPGWVVGPPDFVGVGAQRSGTTWWFKAICDHPAIHAGNKELHHFDGFRDRPFDDLDVRRYHRRLPRPEGAAIGEWTPRYMHDVWSMALLRRAAPNAKILIMLRDPWARFGSGVLHEEARLRRGVRRSARARVGRTIVSESLSRSLYAPQLTRVLDHFDRSQVLVLQYERCCLEPDRELRRTYRFLGVDPDHRPAELTARINATPASEAAVPEHLRASVLPILARDLEALASDVPGLDFDLWPSAIGMPTPAGAAGAPLSSVARGRARSR